MSVLFIEVNWLLLFNMLCEFLRRWSYKQIGSISLSWYSSFGGTALNTVTSAFHEYRRVYKLVLYILVSLLRVIWTTVNSLLPKILSYMPTSNNPLCNSIIIIQFTVPFWRWVFKLHLFWIIPFIKIIRFKCLIK